MMWARRKKIAGGILLIAFGVGAYLKMGSSRQRGVTYQLSKVTRGEVKSTILSTGVVAPVNRLDLKPPVTGRIEKVLVAEGQIVKKGQILIWMSSTERAALIDTASSKGPEEMKYWEDSYKMTPILAPKRGLIILKNADSGQTVTQSDTVLSMSDRLMVKANVDETDLALVKLGQTVTLQLDAFPSNPMPSKVIRIGYDAKTVSNVTTYEVDVMADDIPDFMKSGMTANLTFLIAEQKNVLLVSAASVRREKGKTFVLIPNPEAPEEPLQKEVKLGITDGKKVEILDGVTEGQEIMTAALRSFAGKPGERGNNPYSPFGGSPPGGGGQGGPRH